MSEFDQAPQEPEIAAETPEAAEAAEAVETVEAAPEAAEAAPAAEAAETVAEAAEEAAPQYDDAPSQPGPAPDFGQAPPPQYQAPPYGQAPYGQPQYGYGPTYEQFVRPIGFVEAYKNFWTNYANFNDRTSRSGYWFAYLWNCIVQIVISIIIGASGVTAGLAIAAGGDPTALATVGLGGLISSYIILVIFGLATLIPSLAITIRRLHDTGRSWPYIFFALIPIAGGIILLVFLATATKLPPENRFANQPQV